jgi:hypothetical protein
MGVPTSEVFYISATTGREDHEVHKGHVALDKKKQLGLKQTERFANFCPSLVPKMEHNFTKNAKSKFML